MKVFSVVHVFRTVWHWQMSTSFVAVLINDFFKEGFNDVHHSINCVNCIWAYRF